MKKRLFTAALALAMTLSMAVPGAALSAPEALSLLEEHYVDPIPAAAYEAQTLEELLAALGDPYTVYYTAEEYEEFVTSIDGEKLVGIGVSLQTAYEDGFVLLAILPDSPALEAGLQAGDAIIAVNGRTLTPQDDPVSLITGEEGTAVTLTVRTVAGEVKDFTLTRRTVQIPIVTWEQRGSVGFIDCTSFGDSTATSVRQAIYDLDADTAVWVMDLRSNPGGTTTAAAGAAGQFVGRNLMVRLRDSEDIYYNTSTTAYCPDQTDKPLIILTGPTSASAAELFSAAIRDHRGGIAIGQRTYGKGTAQKIYGAEKYPELFDGDALKITTYRFFSPDGATNHISGIIPTLLVPPLYSQSVAMLLSAPRPERNVNTLKLELCGHTFYLDRELSLSQPKSLTALLEALPPDATLFRGTGTNYWREVTPQEVAEEYGVSYTPRRFADLEGHLWQREIDTLYTYGLVAGWDDGLFHPDRTLTRAQLAAIVTAALDLPVPDRGRSFPDVPADAWYADAVAAMTARGFMTGLEDGTFAPEATLTNAELYTVYSAVAAWASTEGYEWSQKEVSAVQWAELYEYPEWAQAHARNLDQLGVTVDKEHPSAPATRGAAAGALCQLLENIHLLWND